MGTRQTGSKSTTLSRVRNTQQGTGGTYGGAKPQDASALPPELRAVALIDIDIARASIGVSASHWSDLVRAGIAPQPAVRAHRCTRWRLSDVIDFAQRVAERGEVA